MEDMDNDEDDMELVDEEGDEEDGEEEEADLDDDEQEDDEEENGDEEEEDDGNMETGDSDIILDFKNKRTGLKASVVAKYSKESDAIVAKMIVGGQTRYLKINLRPIRSVVLNALSNQVGWSWRDVKRSATKLVRKVGSRKLLNQVTKVLNDPRFAKGMALASTVYPPLGITYGAVRASAKLVDAASSGSGGALERIQKIRTLAESGNIEALKTVRAMNSMYQAKKTGADIGAWYDSIVAQNANPDRPNLITKSRGFYSTGMNAPMKVLDVKVF